MQEIFLWMAFCDGGIAMKKQWLVEGFCPVDRYHCLMPVEYESVEQNGMVIEYNKKRMACRNAVAGSCDKLEECQFFKEAPETLDKNVCWYSR